MIDVKRKLYWNTSLRGNDTIDFHPTQPWILAARYYSPKVRLYNIDSRVVNPHTFTVYDGPVRSIKFIARKNWYVMGAGNQLLICDCATRREFIAFEAHNNNITSIAVHPTASIILTAGHGVIHAWDWDKLSNKNQARRLDYISPPPPSHQTYRGHDRWTKHITFNSRDPDTFASAGDDGTVKIWSITSPFERFTIKADDNCVFWVDFYPGDDKPYLVTANSDHTVKIWDYLSQTCVYTLQGHTAQVNVAIFHPSLPIIISGSDDRSIKVWNSSSYELEHTLKYLLARPLVIVPRRDSDDVAVASPLGVVILEFSYSGTSPMEKLGGDMSVKSSKDQTEREPELSQSINNLVTAYDTTLSISTTSTSTTLSQPHEVHENNADRYRQYSTLALELISTKSTNKLISELKDDKAQCVVDFLSKMVSDEETFTRRERKYTLHLLSKLAKSAEIFPQSLELVGVQCDLTDFLAAGGYGFIYKGEYEGIPICVKAVQIGSQGISRRKMRAHASELTIWAHLKHLNILPFIGIYPSEERVSRICIVSPWMNNGDLLQYLEMVPDAPRKPLVRDIISGLQYLHDLDIIHADLKAKNVLVSETGRAMLADFGVSRLSVTLTTNLTNTGAGTAFWMAPELLVEDKPPSCESDIWAFACTCYETITRTMPFIEYRSAPLLIGGFMRGKIVPSKPTPEIGWDEDVWSVAERCWKSDPASRPKAHEILEIMNSFDYLDNRSEGLESTRSRSFAEIDYDRVLSIFEEIRQSAIV